MAFRIGLITTDSHIIACSADNRSNVELFKVDESAVARVAKWQGCKPASAVAKSRVYAIRRTTSFVTFGNLSKQQLTLDVSNGRTVDAYVLGELLLPRNATAARVGEMADAMLACLHSTEKETAVLRGVALVYWSQGDPWASYTLLPLTVIKEHRSILGPLLLSTLGWQSRPPSVTFGLDRHVARMLLSVWEGNIDWSCPGDERRGTLNFLDPAQGEDELYTWIDSDGQNCTAKRVEMQVLVPQTDPRERIRASSLLHGVRLRVSEDSTHLAEVTLQQAAEAVQDRARGVLYYRLQNLVAGQDEPWLSDLLSSGGRQRAAGEGLQLWASAEADGALLVTRKEGDGAMGTAEECSSGNGGTLVQNQRRVVCQLDLAELRGLTERGQRGAGLALAPDALLMLVHHHYLAAPFSRQLLQQADKAIVELWEVVRRQQQQAQGEQARQQQEDEAEQQVDAGGRSGSQQDTGIDGPKASKRRAEQVTVTLVSGCGDGELEEEVVQETPAKRARQEDGHPDFDVSKLQQLAEACAANARSAPNSPAQQMLTPGPRMDPAGHAPGAGTTGPGAQGVLPTAAQHIAGTPAAEGPQPCMEADVAAGCPRRAPSSPSRQGRPVAEREQPELVTGQESDPPSVKDTADRAARLVPEAPQLQPPDTVTRPPPTETARGPALDPGALAALRTLEGYLHKQQGVLEQGRSQVLALRTEREGLRMQLEQQSRVRADAEEEARKLREELRSYRAAAEAQARAELEQQQAAAAAAARRAAEVQSQRDGEHEQLRGQYKELQGRHQEVCDKHLQLLARYEELLGDRGALQQQVTALQGRLTAAEQRAVAAERRAMEASAGMRTAAA